MSAYFENLNRQSVTRCFVTSEAAEWHWKHGWLYNVRGTDGRPMGVCYVTLLCGSGV